MVTKQVVRYFFATNLLADYIAFYFRDHIYAMAKKSKFADVPEPVRIRQLFHPETKSGTYNFVEVSGHNLESSQT
jgi:hypothetical protein